MTNSGYFERDNRRFLPISCLLTAPILCCVLAGCASEGPLRPPSLMLPAAVRGLSAQRDGNAVTLHWTAPTHTTDGILLTGRHGAGHLTAEICRDEAPRVAAACTSVGRVSAESGAAGQFTDNLPADLSAGAPRPIRYRVRLRNEVDQPGQATDAEALAGSAPAAIRGLEAHLSGDGVALHWQPAGGGDRVLLRVTRGSGNEAKQALLSVDSSARTDGGTLDTGAKPGVEQVYTVFRTQAVTTSGTTLTMNGESATVHVAANAPVAPPAAPAGLAAIANTLGTPEVDLVWQPVAERGVMGYLVFRAEGQGLAVQLTPQPVTSFSYADTAVKAGETYRYSLAAIGPGGIVGSLAQEISITVTNP